MKNDNSTESPNLAKRVLGDAFYPDLNFSVIENIQREFMNKASKDFDNHLKKYVTENLKKIGFEFDSEQDFNEFISKRVTRIGFTDKPNEYELYVDYQTENKKLIGFYSDKISFSHEGSKVTATFGFFNTIILIN